MIGRAVIERAIDVLVAQCEPERVFVVGSHATGTARPGSDLDLLVIAESVESKRQRDLAVELLLAPLMVPVDVNVYTPAEFEREVRERYGFARMVTEFQGQLVYTRDGGRRPFVER